MSQDQKLGPSPEQILYANILNKGMLLGLGILLITCPLTFPLTSCPITGAWGSMTIYTS